MEPCSPSGTILVAEFWRFVPHNDINRRNRILLKISLNHFPFFFAGIFLKDSQGCRGNGNSHGNSHKNGNGMGMGIVVILWEFPRGNPMGIPTWECCGNSHVGILWEFHGNPMGIPMWESCGNSRILCEFPCGNPMGIPTWECCGNSHVESYENSMGILWEFPCGNPVGILESYVNSHVGILWESCWNSNVGIL